MARKPDIQYIRYVTDGSSARAVQPLFPKVRTRLPKIRIRMPEFSVVRIDLLAAAGIIISVLMLALIVVSSVQLSAVQQEANVMDDYVDHLKTENARLTDEYRSGYDLRDIEQKALALGLVPVEQVQRISVDVPLPETTETAEEGSFVTFLTGLFE